MPCHCDPSLGLTIAFFILSSFRCLNLLFRDSEIPEGLARDVIKTHKIVLAAVQSLLKNQSKIDWLHRCTEDENFVENALNLPCPQAYKALLQDLRFDYMDMKDPADTTLTHFKHHY